MNDLMKTGTKKNHKKGISASAKARKREEAIERQVSYSKKTLQEKLKTAGPKERARLEKKKESQ